jgi:hypothetical protein
MNFQFNFQNLIEKCFLLKHKKRITVSGCTVFYLQYKKISSQKEFLVWTKKPKINHFSS